MLSETFDVPEGIVRGSHSSAFSTFLWNWFGDTQALTHGELDLSFLRELSPDELAIARDLIRRNLRLRYTHIIEGTSALHDIEAAPLLRAMLKTEPDISRRLVISGALWKLVKDPVFVACLEEARQKGDRLLTGAHILQVLWLDDERAVDFLIDLLDHRDNFTRTQALGLLNSLEFGRYIVAPAEMLSGPEDYRRRRLDSIFRTKMIDAVRKWNRGMKNGR